MPTISEPSDSDRRTMPVTPAASGDVEAARQQLGRDGALLEHIHAFEVAIRAECREREAYDAGRLAEAVDRAEAAGLDVERLARADHVKSGGRCQDFGAADHEWQDHLAAARAVAAEYARLVEDAHKTS